MMTTTLTSLAKRCMKTGRRRLSDRAGLALIATILVLALVAVLTATAMTGAMSSTRVSGSDYEDSRVFYASEAGGEATLAQLSVALKDGYLTDDELANIYPPDIDGISFDSFTVRKVGDSYVETITDGPYAGLYALTQDVEVYSQAVNANGDVSAVILRTKAQAIPVFQFGVFFEEDLEATNGPPMEFVGRVHSNGNIYLSSNNAWYRELITTPKKVFHDRKDHHKILDGVYIDDASGNEVPLDFDSRTHPDPEAFKSASCSKFDCRLQTDAFGVDPLRMPLPEGIPMIEVVRPREDSDTESEREVKFAWNADMYVEVDLNDIRTKADVCANGGPKKDPDYLDGNLQITGLQKVEPGKKISFKILGVPCGQIDEVDIAVYSNDVLIYEFQHGNSCTFDIDIPSDTDVLKIVITSDDDDDPQINGTAIWYGLQSVNDTTPWPMTTVTRSGGREVPVASEVCNMFWWQWSAFYDGREDELKDVLNVDIAQIETWSSAGSSRTIEVIYVDLIAPNSIAGFPTDAVNLMIDGSLDPAVRALNGATLPNPMTVSTEWPIYVKGDYNDVAKKPAALTGDGITILSNAWDDSQNRPDQTVFDDCVGLVSDGVPCPAYVTWTGTWSKKNAAETTVNGAILAGHWPTPCDHEESTCIADGSTSYYTNWYGGGLENFPRFLEKWSGIFLHYKGALISPFTSQKTTGTWNGSYYSPPKRDWHFDTDFNNPAKLPPGTPNVGYVIRTAMREAF